MFRFLCRHGYQVNRTGVRKPHGATAMHSSFLVLGSACRSVACRLHALQSEASKFPGTLGSGLDAGVFGMDQDAE